MRNGTWRRNGMDYMTIQQEVYEKIMRLPEDGIRLILVLADEIARQSGLCYETIVETEESELLRRKKEAFQNMLEMREQSSYPKDFDYKKVMEEAINENECAVHAQADYIVTCNVKDFKQAKTSVVTPDLFIKNMAESK